jgi:hypothetical protein
MGDSVHAQHSRSQTVEPFSDYLCVLCNLLDTDLQPLNCRSRLVAFLGFLYWQDSVRHPAVHVVALGLL